MLRNIESEDKTKLYNFYSSSKAEVIINESDTDVSINLETLETFTKSKTRITSALAFLVIKTRKNIEFLYQKNIP